MELLQGEVAQAIQKLLEENPGLQLHPGRAPEEWALLVIKKGGCPCVPGRDNCPCDEALDDIEQLNHCRCYLFCNEAYLKIYDEVVVKRRRARAPGGNRQETGAGIPSGVQAGVGTERQPGLL